MGSILAWRIPGTGEPGGLPSMGSQSWTRLKRLSSLAAAYGLKGSLWEFNLRQSGKSHKVINALQLLFTRLPQDRALEQLTVQGPSHAKGQ